MKKFTGLGVAMVTPFNKKLEVDYVALEKLTNYLIDNDVDYLVVQGTTGESVTLSDEEKTNVLNFIVKINDGRLPIVIGVGGNNTIQVGKQIEMVSKNRGVDGILSVSPYYNKPTQEGVFEHFKHISSKTSLPIIIYNVPGRTASNILPETTIKLAEEIDNIVAIKDACGNLAQSMKVMKNAPKNFSVLSGDDDLVLPFISSGGDGIISVIGNAYPNEFSKIVHQSLKGNIKSIQQNNFDLLDFIDMLFEEGNPAGIKQTLHYLGICDSYVRLPLIKASDDLSNRLKKFVKK